MTRRSRRIRRRAGFVTFRAAPPPVAAGACAS
jgi:hypothetical protein